jgi:hypothetical protein
MILQEFLFANAESLWSPGKCFGENVGCGAFCRFNTGNVSSPAMTPTVSSLDYKYEFTLSFPSFRQSFAFLSVLFYYGSLI